VLLLLLLLHCCIATALDLGLGEDMDAGTRAAIAEAGES
jgi:hypothetical protein